MQGISERLPVLRALSPLRLGFAEAGSLVFVGSLACFVLILVADLEPRRSLLEALAQVGATLLVGYAVEASWLLRVSAVRSAGRERWVGLASGIGASGVLGVGLALALSGRTGGSQLAIEQLAFSWSAFSLIMLGAFVGLLPMMLYDWAHSARTEYPDE